MLKLIAAKPSDFIARINFSYMPDVFRLLYNVIEDMKQKNIDKWDEIYPNSRTLRNDFESGSLYGYVHFETLIAFFALNEEQPKEYNSIPWENIHSNALIIPALQFLPYTKARESENSCWALQKTLPKSLDTIP